MLTSPEISNALLDSHTAGLLVGGTVGALWDGDIAARSGLDVLEIDAADHLLYTDGDWSGSFDNLGRTLGSVERFARGLV